MSGAILAEDLHVGYAGTPVVRDVSLSVEPGEVVALVGPNGAGKTTVLQAISGMLPALRGRVEVFGAPVRPGRPHHTARRSLAYVPDDRSLFFGLTVRENLRLGARSNSADVETVLEYFPALRPLLNRRAGLLSGGEQQMLAVGRALVSRPKALVVDEMSLGLAPAVVARLLPVLRRIAEESGAAVLVVEQHVHLALGIADRAYVLSHGQLTYSGPAADLLQERELLHRSYLGEALSAE